MATGDGGGGDVMGVAPGGGSCLQPDQAKNAPPRAATVTNPAVQASHPPASWSGGGGSRLGAARRGFARRARSSLRTELFRECFAMGVGSCESARPFGPPAHSREPRGGAHLLVPAFA